MPACPVCYNPNADTEPWEGMIRCKDHEECGRYLREVFMAPVDNMEHPRLEGLPEIAQDVCARHGDPLLMVGGGSFNLSDLCRMMIGEGEARAQSTVDKLEGELRRTRSGHANSRLRQQLIAVTGYKNTLLHMLAGSSTTYHTVRDQHLALVRGLRKSGLDYRDYLTDATVE